MGRQDHLAWMQYRERSTTSQHHPARGRGNDAAAGKHVRGCVNLRRYRQLPLGNRLRGKRGGQDSERGGVRR